MISSWVAKLSLVILYCANPIGIAAFTSSQSNFTPFSISAYFSGENMLISFPTVSLITDLLKCCKRSVIRLTVGKEMNMFSPEKYAEMLKGVKFDWLEVKAAMPIGFAQYRMTKDNFATHEEIMEFYKKIAGLAGLEVVDEKMNSRVVLLARKDRIDRKLAYDWDKPEYDEFINNLTDPGCSTGGVHEENSQLIP